MTVPAAVRLERLRRREIERHCAASEEFLAWAAAYDDGGPEIRSRALHEAWLSRLPCPVLRLDGALTTEERVVRTLAALDDPI